MKKIEEAAKDYSAEYYLFNEDMRMQAETHFEAGVEFAQRWINVKEELPNIGDHILIKLIGDKLKIWRIFNEDDRTLVSNYATHWRPIELK